MWQVPIGHGVWYMKLLLLEVRYLGCSISIGSLVSTRPFMTLWLFSREYCCWPCLSIWSSCFAQASVDEGLNTVCCSPYLKALEQHWHDVWVEDTQLGFYFIIVFVSSCGTWLAQDPSSLVVNLICLVFQMFLRMGKAAHAFWILVIMSPSVPPADSTPQGCGGVASSSGSSPRVTGLLVIVLNFMNFILLLLMLSPVPVCVDAMFRHCFLLYLVMNVIGQPGRQRSQVSQLVPTGSNASTGYHYKCYKQHQNRKWHNHTSQQKKDCRARICYLNLQIIKILILIWMWIKY